MATQDRYGVKVALVVCASTRGAGIDGDLRVGTNRFNVTGSNGNTQIDGTLGSDGNLRVGAGGANTFQVIAANGLVATTGNVEADGTIGSDGNLRVGAAGSAKFTVTASDGSVASVGNVETDGTLGADGGLRVGAAGATHFQVSGADGNTSTAGTLAVAGKLSVGSPTADIFAVDPATGDTTVSGTLKSTGNLNVGADGASKVRVTAASGNTEIDGTLSVKAGGATAAVLVNSDKITFNKTVLFAAGAEGLSSGGGASPAELAGKVDLVESDAVQLNGGLSGSGALKVKPGECVLHSADSNEAPAPVGAALDSANPIATANVHHQPNHTWCTRTVGESTSGENPACGSFNATGIPSGCPEPSSTATCFNQCGGACNAVFTFGPGGGFNWICPTCPVTASCTLKKHTITCTAPGQASACYSYTSNGSTGAGSDGLSCVSGGSSGALLPGCTTEVTVAERQAMDSLLSTHAGGDAKTCFDQRSPICPASHPLMNGSFNNAAHCCALQLAP